MMRKTTLALAAAGLILVSAAVAWRPFSPTEATTSAQAPLQAENPPPQAPDLPALAARLASDVSPLTPEQIAEQRRMVHEQVAHAAQLLASRNLADRIGATEQLAAYPVPEAEQHLVRALAEDEAAEVRAAAARALAYLKTTDPRSIAALLDALRTGKAAVRAAALQTLATYLNHLERESAAFRQISKGLAGFAKSRHLDKATRQVLRELLARPAG